LGKERHDVGRENDKGYPVRSILKNNYFYSINFEPNRWPAGNPETGYLNTDGSPTKSEILNLKRDNVNSVFWELAFGKRPKETLYNLINDPRCLVNIADNNAFMDIKSDLNKILIRDLINQKDPRVMGRGKIFDNYIYAHKKTRNFHERYTNGDSIYAGWVNESDFEKLK
jgi:hypothetical protein